MPFRTAMLALVASAAALLSGAASGHGPNHDESNGGPRAGAPADQTPFGQPGDPGKASRTIQVDMNDAMRFAPSAIEVRQNDTVRFIVKNSGSTMHEMVLGTLAGLKAHHALMQKHPGMEHDGPYMAHVAPGRSETIVWRFTRPGEFVYGCLIPGHFEAGMVGRVIVKQKATR